MSETPNGSPRISKSVFVLVPKEDEKNFVWVVDKNKEPDRKKLPGGGKETEDRTISNAAATEVYQEVGLTIDPPTIRILEVHKYDQSGSHQWVAMKSLPPSSSKLLASRKEELPYTFGEGRARLEAEMEVIRKEWPLEKGEDIEKADWASRDLMLQYASDRVFFTDHGRAVKWYLSGAWAQAHNIYARAERKEISWDEADKLIKHNLVVKSFINYLKYDVTFIEYYIDDDGCLVVCYDPQCKECDREEAPEPKEAPKPKEITMASELRRPSLLSLQRPTAYKPMPTLPADQKVSGEIHAIIILSDKREDTAYFRRNFFYGYGYNANERYPHAVEPFVMDAGGGITVEALAEKLGVKATRQVTNGHTVLFTIEAGKPKHDLTSFVPISLNAAPPYDLVIGSAFAKLIPEAVDNFNRLHASKKIWMHDDWRHASREGRAKKEKHHA